MTHRIIALTTALYLVPLNQLNAILINRYFIKCGCHNLTSEFFPSSFVSVYLVTILGTYSLLDLQVRTLHKDRQFV